VSAPGAYQAVATAYHGELRLHLAEHRVSVTSARGALKANCSCGWQTPRYTAANPAPAATHGAAMNEAAVSAAAISADYQLWDLRSDPALALRGIPVIGAGPGAIRHTRPESCLARLLSLQVSWLAAQSRQPALTQDGTGTP
jgi:hypothetical protein